MYIVCSSIRSMQRLSMSHVNRKEGKLRLWGIPSASLLFSQLIAWGIRRASAFFMFRDISREASARQGELPGACEAVARSGTSSTIFWIFSAGSLWHTQFSWRQFSMEPIFCSASGPPDFGSGLDSTIFQAPHLLQQPSTYLPGACKRKRRSKFKVSTPRRSFQFQLVGGIIGEMQKVVGSHLQHHPQSRRAVHLLQFFAEYL